MCCFWNSFVLYYVVSLGQASSAFTFHLQLNSAPSILFPTFGELLIGKSIPLGSASQCISESCLLQQLPQHNVSCCVQWLLPSTILWTLSFSLPPASITDLVRRLQVSPWLVLYFLEEFCRSAEDDSCHSCSKFAMSKGLTNLPLKPW